MAKMSLPVIGSAFARLRVQRGIARKSFAEGMRLRLGHFSLGTLSAIEGDENRRMSFDVFQASAKVLGVTEELLWLETGVEGKSMPYEAAKLRAYQEARAKSSTRATTHQPAPEESPSQYDAAKSAALRLSAAEQKSLIDELTSGGRPRKLAARGRKKQ